MPSPGNHRPSRDLSCQQTLRGFLRRDHSLRHREPRSLTLLEHTNDPGETKGRSTGALTPSGALTSLGGLLTAGWSLSPRGPLRSGGTPWPPLPRGPGGASWSISRLDPGPRGAPTGPFRSRTTVTQENTRETPSGRHGPHQSKVGIAKKPPNVQRHPEVPFDPGFLLHHTDDKGRRPLYFLGIRWSPANRFFHSLSPLPGRVQDHET